MWHRKRCLFLLGCLPTALIVRLVTWTIQEDLHKDELFAARRKTLQDSCRKWSNQEHRANTTARLSQFLIFTVDEESHAFCSVQKAGSNSINNYLQNVVVGKIAELRPAKDSQIQTNAKAVLPIQYDCFPSCASKSKKAILVRDPLQRVYSAWKYIFDYEGGHNFGLRASYSWPEFVNNLINGTGDQWLHVQEAVGVHWQPFWKACSVCTEELMPDYILKLESISSDIGQYLRQILPSFSHEDISHLVSEFPHENPGETQSHPVPQDLYHYSLLRRHQVRALYQVYARDYELFGYDPDKYISLAAE